MNRLRCFLGAVAAAWLISTAAASHAAAAPRASKPNAKKQKGAAKANRKDRNKKKGGSQSRLAKEPGEVSFATMRRELGLEPDQAAKLRELWQQRDEALAQWDATSQGQRLVQLRDQLPLTVGAERASLASQTRSLEAQRGQVAQHHDAKILAVLNAEQRARWLGFLLYRIALGRLREWGVHLTAEQAREARTVCDRAAAPLPTAPEGAAMDRAAAEAAREIHAGTLTDKQRQTINPEDKPKKKASKTGYRKAESGRHRSSRRRGRRGGGSKIKRLMRRSGSNGSGGAQPGSGEPVAKPKTMGIGRSKASRIKPKGASATRPPGSNSADLHRSNAEGKPKASSPSKTAARKGKK